MQGHGRIGAGGRGGLDAADAAQLAAQQLGWVCGDPWIVVFKGPRVWYRVLREIVMLERMHRAFSRGLMQYGMIRARKPAALSAPAGAAAGAQEPAAAGFFA